ncbi:MAG TPA: CHAT domain-containing protein [Candidatus Sulfotelmatobacter sp.]|nr:CHAT domain-containing protein [Candidatus Sulfotelmatobacter sp.]
MTTRKAKPGISREHLDTLLSLTGNAARLGYLRKKKLLRATCVEELNAVTQNEMRADTKRALALADCGILLAQRVRRPALLAQSLRIKANVLTAAGQYSEAIELYDVSLKLFTRAKDKEGIARTLTAVIQPHIMLGTYEQAFEAADRARQLFQTLGDTRRLARLENNLGNIYHRQDRFEEALVHYERAYRELLPHGDSEELIISLNNMSMCLISMNDFPRALETYQRAKELLKQRDLPLIRLITDYNVAYLYYLRGDYRTAIEMLKGSRLAAEEISYTYLIALCYLDLSDIYIELNLSEEAKSVAEEGHRLFHTTGIGYEAAKALTNQAIAYGQDGKTRRSLELFAEAKALFEKEQNEVYPWLIDLYQAIVLFHEGRHYESRRMARGAADYFDQCFLKNKAVVCHFVLAQVALRTGNPQEAHKECAKALEYLERLDAPILRYQAHFLLGQVEQTSGNPAAAYEQYQLARSYMEGLRSSLGRDELKISFMKNKSELYECLVDLYLDEKFPENSQEEAFRCMETAKSRSLVELIFRHGGALPETKPGQSELVHKIRELREELNWYQHRIELEQLRPEANAASRIERLRSDAQEKERQLLRVLGEAPTSVAGNFGSAPHQGPSLDTIRNFLENDTALVEYFLVRDTILAAVLTRKTLEIGPVTTLTRISEPLRLLRFQLSKFQLQQQSMGAVSDNSYSATLAHLGSLYSELLAPVRQQLTARHLVVVPHGPLHYLPFHALRDGESYLADSYEISYAPSASVYALCHERNGKPRNRSLVLGVPDAHAPLIREEVECVHRVLPGSDLFLGEAANHQTFLERARSSHIIHVATHGSFRPDNPMFSGVRLGDGYLYLYELYNMQMSVELLTLSGCATGLNVVAAGDELLGLIRGALYAGARALLLTLWEVNDRSTTTFMTSFYRQLPTAPSKAAALAQAAREVREQHPHPFHWAPFVLVGKAFNDTAGDFSEIRK